MTTPEKTANWYAIDLAPGRARGWAMQDDRAVAQAQAAPPPDLPARETVEALVARLRAEAPGARETPTLVCGYAEAAAPVTVPAKPGDLAPVPLPGGEVRALPGLRQDSPPGLMHGAELRIAGFLTLNPRWDGVICLPGPITHWALLSAEEVVSFQSFLTGETADALAAAPSLRAVFAGTDWDEAAFDAALDTAMSRPERLAAGLAAIQAEAAQGAIGPGQARARLHGLLLGAELAAARPYWLGQQVAVIGPDEAAGPYVTALQRQGLPVTQADETRMTLAGFTAAWRRTCARA